MESTERTDARGRTGQLAERAVRNWTEQCGWQLIAQNIRWRDGEIDLISIDDHTLVFVEVKALVARGSDHQPPFSPFESITLKKQARIRKLARRWLVDDLRRLRADHKMNFDTIRFDAFAVTMLPNDEVHAIEHLRDVF